MCNFRHGRAHCPITYLENPLSAGIRSPHVVSLTHERPRFVVGAGPEHNIVTNFLAHQIKNMRRLLRNPASVPDVTAPLWPPRVATTSTGFFADIPKLRRYSSYQVRRVGANNSSPKRGRAAPPPQSLATGYEDTHLFEKMSLIPRQRFAQCLRK